MALRLTLLFFFLFFLNVSFSQQRLVRGMVTDRQGEALIGATVRLKGSSRGTATGLDGSYELRIPSGQENTLLFSYTGMQPREVKVGQRERVDVILNPDIAMIDEVVVTAYAGEKKEKDLVGSYEQVKGDDLLPARPIESFDKLLEGQVAGVQVEAGTGEPGLPVRVRIRGEGSLPPVFSSDVSASGQPLYVLDGVPLYDITEANSANTPFSSTLEQRLNPLMFIDPNDIESLTVLKDAAATAIYGANAANGVVLITTKSGKAGKNRIDASVSQGFSSLINEVQFLNTRQYVELFRETLFNSQGNPEDAGPTDIETDWRGLTQRTGSVTNASLTASGGGESAQYRLSSSYYNNEAISKGNSLERVSLLLNVTAPLSEKLKLRSTLSGGYAHKESFSNFGAFTYPPNISPYNEDGSFNNSGFFINRPNPVAALEQNEFFHDAFSVKSSLRLSYEILPGLQLQGTAGIDGYLQLQNRFNSALNGSGRSRNGFALRFNRANLQWIGNAQAAYRKEWADHHFSILGGAEATRQNTRLLRVSATNFPFDNLRQLWTLDNDDTAVTESNYVDATQSFYGQMSYDYGYKYYLTSSIRRDASSIFGGDVNAANFFALGLGWAFTEENLLAGLDWLDYGKLRASYGVTGNSRLGTYSARGLYAFSTSSGYGSSVGLSPSAPANEDLTWEVVRKYNFGLDLELLDSRLKLGLEHYQHFTEDAISSIPIPFESGFRTIIANAANLRNWGWEGSVQTVNTQGALRWTSRFNIARNRNRVTEIVAERLPTSSFFSRGIVEGQDANAIYGIPFAGVDPYNGKALYFLPDGSITDDVDLANKPDNWVVIGRGTPTFYGGFTNTLSYKGLSASLLISYSYGSDITVDALTFTDGRQISFNNQSANQLDRWQQPGDLTDTPRLHVSNPVQRNNTRYLFDNDFINFANLNIDWRLPQRWLSAARLRNVSLSLQVDNLGYIYSTTSRQGRNGIAEYRYNFPRSRTWMFGLKVGL